MSHNPWNSPADGRLDVLELVNWNPASDSSNPMQITAGCEDVVMHSDQSLAIREDRTAGDAAVAVTVTGNQDSKIHCKHVYHHVSARAAILTR